MLNIINAILDIICLLSVGANICVFLLYYKVTREMKKAKRQHEDENERS